MGAPREAVLAAEEQYRLEQEQRQKLAKRRSIQRNAFGAHFCVSACVNLMLLGINLLTYHDDPELWELYPVIAWGTAVLLHALVTIDHCKQGPNWTLRTRRAYSRSVMGLIAAEQMPHG